MWQPRHWSDVTYGWPLGCPGKSGGTYDNLGPRSIEDSCDAIAWIAEQEWCDGNVGMFGMSYFAIVQNMVEHSKAGEGQRAPTDLNDLLNEYVTLAHHGLQARVGYLEVAINRNLDDAVGTVDLVPQDMGRVFMNLIGNAFDALKQSGGNRTKAAEALGISRRMLQKKLKDFGIQ